jgi:kinesin family protein 18/19
MKKFDDEKKDQSNKLEIIEEETKNYLDDLKKGTYNIMVAVRCRPLWPKEKDFSDHEIVKILDRKMVILLDPYEYNGPNEIFKNRSREQTYAFDFAFDKSCNQVNFI